MKFKKSLLPLTLAGALIFSGCDLFFNFFNNKNNIPKPVASSSYSLVNPSLTNLGGNYLKPSGISAYHSNLARDSNSRDLVSEINNEFIFAQRPIYTIGSDGKITFVKAPKISKYSETIANRGNPKALTDAYSLFEFGLEDASSFATTVDGENRVMPDGLMPKQISLETLVLPDSSILLSSSQSRKIFKVTPDGNGGYVQSTFAEDDSLVGITDMMLDEASNKAYFAKNSQSVLAVDLNTKEILEEIVFDLNAFDSTKYVLGGSGFFIAKNSAKGFEDTGNKFYVTDFLNQVIYGVDGTNQISLIKKDIGHPSGIAVSENGEILISFAPILGFVPSGEYIDGNPIYTYPGITQHSRIDTINPNDSEMRNLYTFENEDLSNFLTGDSIWFTNGNYGLALGCNISLSTEETLNKLVVNLANELAGTLDSLELIKNYAPNLEIISPPTGTYTSASAPLSLEYLATDPENDPLTYSYSVNSGSKIPIDPLDYGKPISLAHLVGENNWTIYVSDNAGNETVSNVSFSVTE